jgi:hypothetical protein
MVYCLISLLYSFRIAVDPWAHPLLVLIGISGAVVAVPESNLLATIATTVYMSLFRLFLLLELEYLRSRKAGPTSLFTVLATLLLCSYAMAEALSSYNRKIGLGSGFELFHTQIPSFWFDCGYILLSVVYLGFALAMNGWTSTRRFLFFAVVVIVTSGVTHLARIWSVDMGYEKLFETVHVCLGGMTVSLLQASDEQQYENIDQKDDPLGLEIEQASDGEEEIGE